MARALRIERAAERFADARGPNPELVGERWRCLREWRWTSYRSYAGYEAGR